MFFFFIKVLIVVIVLLIDFVSMKVILFLFGKGGVGGGIFLFCSIWGVLVEFLGIVILFFFF